MINLLAFHQWFLAGHIISVMFWMGSLYYLPRLFVYNSIVPNSSNRWKLLLKMEHRLLRIIATPSLLSSWFFGLLLFWQENWTEVWLWLKLIIVIFLSGYHGFCVYCYKRFLEGKIPYSHRFFRLMNEIPPILTVVIVILVILKPF